jgi:hypothetical protein
MIIDYRKSIGAPYDVNRDALMLTEEQKKRLKAYEGRYEESQKELEEHFKMPH